MPKGDYALRAVFGDGTQAVAHDVPANALVTLTETTLKVAGKVTKTAVNTTFDVAGAAFKKGAVTVIDTGTGVSRKVPWEEGLRVSKLSSPGRAVEIVRDAQKIQATTNTVLRAGDVVRLN